MQSTQGNSKVDNGVSNSQGQLSTKGWGAWASWQAFPNWQVATGYQQLSYQAQTAGAHQQQAKGTTRHYTAQVSYHGWNAQWREFNFSARPYLSYGYSQLPRLEFISNLGENLGVVRAQPHSLQLGVQATASYRNLSAQLGLTQHLLNQEVVFADAFGRERLTVHPQQWQVNTSLSYQFNQNWSAHAYLQAQARSSNYGIGLAWKW